MSVYAPRHRGFGLDDVPYTPARVYLLDDEQPIVTALSRLLRAHGFSVAAFTSPEMFLGSIDSRSAGCVVLDVAMPDLDGLAVQRALTDRQCSMPIVFLTGRGDVPVSVQAMKSGALEFLTKPVDAERLVGAVGQALEQDRVARADARERADLLKRLGTLTRRERDVLRYAVTGRMNKQIGAELGIGLKTVKVHRARFMQKLGIDNVADLIRFADRVGVERAAGGRYSSESDGWV